MERQSRKRRLEEHIIEEVHTIFTEGEPTYLRTLSRDALLEVLESELRFLGLYPHDDQEAPEIIRSFLEHHIDQWIENHILQKSSTTGIPLVKATQYYSDFLVPLESSV